MVGSATISNVKDGFIVVLRHFQQKGCMVLMWSQSSEGELLWPGILDTALGPGWKTTAGGYGTKYVWLGYLPVTTKSFYLDIWGACKGKDIYGNALSSLPMMTGPHTLGTGIHTGADFIAVLGAIADGEASYYRAYETRVPKPIVINVDVQENLVIEGYWARRAAGTVQGDIDGPRGAAEYELLSGIKGFALSYMTASILAMGFTAGAIAIHNIFWLLNRGSRRVMPATKGAT
jgi:hypothetical protein